MTKRRGASPARAFGIFSVPFSRSTPQPGTRLPSREEVGAVDRWAEGHSLPVSRPAALPRLLARRANPESERRVTLAHLLGVSNGGIGPRRNRRQARQWYRHAPPHRAAGRLPRALRGLHLDDADDRGPRAARGRVVADPG